MDIPALSMEMAQSQTLQAVGTAILGMQLDTINNLAATEIEALDSMPTADMELSINPNIGGNIDISL